MYARECVDNTSPGWYFPTRLYSSRSDLYGIGNIINYIIWVPAYNIVYYYDSLISLSAFKRMPKLKSHYRVLTGVGM